MKYWVLVLVVFVVCEESFAELPILEWDSFSESEWEIFIVRTIAREFPEELTALQGVRVIVWKAKGREAGVSGLRWGNGIRLMIFSWGFLKLLQDEEDLLGVLAHEIAHVKYRHGHWHQLVLLHLRISTLTKREVAADAYAFQALEKRGYDFCSFRRIFESTVPLELDLKSEEGRMLAARRVILNQRCGATLAAK